MKIILEYFKLIKFNQDKILIQAINLIILLDQIYLKTHFNVNNNIIIIFDLYFIVFFLIFNKI